MSDLKSSWESVWSLVALSKQLNNARDFETYLHTQYKSSQAKSLDFAIFDGYTEIFKLTKNQVEQVKQELKNV